MSKFRKFIVCMLTGTLAAQCAFVPVIAAESSDETASVAEIEETTESVAEVLDENDILDGLEEYAEDEKFKDQKNLEELIETYVDEDTVENLEDFTEDVQDPEKTFTTDINVTGSIYDSNSVATTINASAKAVNGPEEGSVDLNVNANGISLDMSTYADNEKVLLKLPGLDKVLSYDFTKDATGSYLEQLVGADTLQALNSAFKMSSAKLDAATTEKLAADIAAVFTDAMGKLEFTPAPEKECKIEDKSVTCQGMQAVITKDDVKDVITKLLDINLPTGQTIREYIEIVTKLQGGSVPSLDEMLAGVDEMKDITLLVYMNEDMPAEIILKTESGEAAIQFRGEVPYSNIALVVDGQDVFAFRYETNDKGFDLVFEAGEKKLVVDIVTKENGFVAAASLDEQMIGTFSVEDNYFSVQSPFLQSQITGTYEVKDDGLSITAKYQDLDVSLKTQEGGTVTKPEGDILELTEMTEEDFAEIQESIGSLFGGSVMGTTAVTSDAA